eukprot:m51a1_g935 putative Cia2, CIA (157) ;mRNA; r:242881-243453
MQNPAPRVFDVASGALRTFTDADLEGDEGAREPIDSVEVYEMIRRIRDPEHPVSLEQLKVVDAGLVAVDDAASRVRVSFTPTVSHCNMATLIGLSIRVKLLRCLPRRFKTDIYLTPGSHSTEEEVNKQLNDKERIAAAMENANLLGVVNKCISDTD